MFQFHLKITAVLSILLVAAIALTNADVFQSAHSKAKASRTKVRADVVAAQPDAGKIAPAKPSSGFSPQTRLGFTSGDQWEPAIATDKNGRVYILYPQYLGVPGCAECPSPTMVLQISGDGGRTWGAPRLIAPPAGAFKTGQYDAQIVVDPIDRQTVYASWLENYKSDIAVAKSTDSGETWKVVIADSTNAGTDKPILAVRGADVYVGYNHAQKVWVSSSHDGGETFTSTVVNPNGQFGWSLAGGGAVDDAGNVYFGWSGYEQNGGAKGNVNLFVSRSTDGGATWTNHLVDVSSSPPDCSEYLCGWAYLGAQITLTAELDGTVYALWNAGSQPKGPERMYFAKSTDRGETWTARQEVSLAPQGSGHAFPAIALGGTSGDVRISWMDSRNAPWWNAYYRRSADGGATWSAEQDISTPASGLSYITEQGFSYPFGDYYELEVDSRGTTHVIMGQGLNWNSPGSIWYTRGN
jgi:hypothetical protein